MGVDRSGLFLDWKRGGLKVHGFLSRRGRAFLSGEQVPFLCGVAFYADNRGFGEGVASKEVVAVVTQLIKCLTGLCVQDIMYIGHKNDI